MASELASGQSLYSPNKLNSPNKQYTLWMQPDGNLVLYKEPISVRTAQWATGTFSLPPEQRPNRADMQTDGHLVLYNDVNVPSWGSGRWGPQYRGAKLQITDDGNAVILMPDGQAIWSIKPYHPPAGQPITHHEEAEVGWGKKMSTTAILYRNGTLTVESKQMNDNWLGGLRGRILVLCVDSNGNNIWISDVLVCPTRCSIPDPCASYGTANFVNNFPEAVGKHTQRLDILQADNPNYPDLRNKFIDGIKALGDIAEEIKNQLDRLVKG